jgi:hypothetical protein
MPTSTVTLLLPLGPAAALGACREAMSEEVWEIESVGHDRLVAREWPWRISCQTRPATVEIHATRAEQGSTKLRLDASVPGLGPIPARHLATHLRGIEQRVRRPAAVESNDVIED